MTLLSCVANVQSRQCPFVMQDLAKISTVEMTL